MRLLALLSLLFLIAGIKGQGELDLSEAFDDPPTVEPTPKREIKPTQKPAGDDFSLDDAVGHGLEATPTKKPQPGQGGGAGGGGAFGDKDLFDGEMTPDDPSGADGHQGGSAMQPSSGGEEPAQGQEKQSVIAGVLSALGVAAVGAISSFVAYQKKKLCFKGQAEDPENVNMDNQKGDQNDPQAQTNLLAK